MMRLRFRVMVALALRSSAFGLVLLVGNAAAVQLPELSAPANGVACQKALLSASRAFLTAKLKALDSCATAALKCIQLKGSTQKCLSKAKTKCDPDALTKIANAEGRLVAKVLANCGESKIPLSDLRAATALGYDTLQAECSEILSGACENPLDPECTTADDPVGIAGCVAFAHGRAAEALFGVAQARAREVIAVAHVEPSTFPDLPDHGGDGAAIVGPGKEAQLVTACLGAIARGTIKLTTAVDTALGDCLAGVLACTKKKPKDQASCLGNASAVKIATQRSTLETAIQKKCNERTLPFATLRNDGIGADHELMARAGAIGPGSAWRRRRDPEVTSSAQ